MNDISDEDLLRATLQSEIVADSGVALAELDSLGDLVANCC